MSRSDKGSAGSGEDGKVTSEQERLQPVAVRADNFSGQGFVQIPLIFSQKNTYYLSIAGNFLAERGGFEPPVRNYRTPAFQASTLNHSDISPCFNA